MMEYWSDGVLLPKPITPIFHHSSNSNLMKFTLNWLKEFVDFDGSSDELSKLLTMAGLEVESLDVAARAR